MGLEGKGQKARPAPKVQHVHCRSRLCRPDDCLRHIVRQFYPARVLVPGRRCCVKIAFFTGHTYPDGGKGEQK
jgi:hypothetical protein